MSNGLKRVNKCSKAGRGLQETEGEAGLRPDTLGQPPGLFQTTQGSGQPSSSLVRLERVAALA